MPVTKKPKTEAAAPSPPMKILSAATKGDWKNIISDDSEVAGAKDDLHKSLVEFFRADNLLVLTGLGTSLCVVDGAKTPLAPTMSALWNATQADNPTEFDAILKKVRYPGKDAKDIELLLSQCHVAHAFDPSAEVAAFIQKAEKIIVGKCSFIKEDLSLTSHEVFLRRVARRSPKLPRTRIFTTNYDLCFETAATRIHFVTVDGFSHTFPQVFDASYFSYDLVRRGEDGSAPDFVPHLFHLYKLHGSVDWEWHEGQVRKKADPVDPALIFPRHSKFETSFEHPFLELMSRYQSALRQPKTSLLVIGFGFNDKHLTQPILSAVRSNVGLRIAVVDPLLESTPSEAAKSLVTLVKQGDQRITLVAGAFEEFVPLLPDLVSETEEERHQDRLRGLRK